MTRRALTLGFALALAGTGCNEDVTAPPDDARALGIVAWHDPPASFAEQAGLEPGADWSEESWGDRPPLVAPDTVESGTPFTVIATTIRPDGCWLPGGYEKESGVSEATITAYDHRADVEACTLVLSWTTREVELQFDVPGEAVVRLVGRRIAGEDFGGGDEFVVERAIVVR